MQVPAAAAKASKNRKQPGGAAAPAQRRKKTKQAAAAADSVAIADLLAASQVSTSSRVCAVYDVHSRCSACVGWTFRLHTRWC